MAKTLYSWILPIKNEEASLPQLFAEIAQAMQGKAYEVIAINDASTDFSSKLLASFARGRLTKLNVIHFSTHQGKWAAMRAGIEKARGEIIITIDSDLQDDPREVSKLLLKLDQGYVVVSGARLIRFDPFYKVLISKLGNNFLSFLRKSRYHDLNSPFKVYRKKVLAQLPKEGSLLRFSLLLAQEMGYKTGEIPIRHRPRLHGQSKFGLVKYARILYDLILVLFLFSGSGRIVKQKP